MAPKTSKNAIVHVPEVEESERQALALVADLKRKGFDLPQVVFDNLDVAGFRSDESQAAVITMAFVSGIDLPQLRYHENIRAVAKAWKWTAEAGAIPGEHYYMVPHDDRQTQGKKTYAPIPAVKWLRTSVDQFGIQQDTKVLYSLETKPLFGAKLLEYLEYYVPAYIEDKNNRGALARFMLWVDGKQQIVDPDANWQFGYYLHKGMTGNSGYPIAVDSKNLSAGAASNTGVRRAQTRAERLACYNVTRTLYKVDAGTIEQHLAMMLSMARNEHRRLAQLPEEEAFIDDDNTATMEGDDDGGIVDGEFTEAKAEAPVVIQTGPEDTGEHDIVPAETAETLTWDELADKVYRESTSATRGIIDELHRIADTGRTSKRKEDTLRTSDQLMKQLRAWVLKAAGDCPDYELAPGLYFANFVVGTVFDIKDENIFMAQAKYFWKLASKKVEDGEGETKSVTFEYQPDMPGAVALIEIATRVDEGVKSVF